jgi:hypothetical protein
VIFKFPANPLSEDSILELLWLRFLEFLLAFLPCGGRDDDCLDDFISVLFELVCLDALVAVEKAVKITISHSPRLIKQHQYCVLVLRKNQLSHNINISLMITVTLSPVIQH